MTTETVLPELVGTLASLSEHTQATIRAYGAACARTALQSPEIQALRDLLKEARQQLPMAAQFWNEDDEPERGSRNVQRVMELIAKIDALMEQKPSPRQGAQIMTAEAAEEFSNLISRQANAAMFSLIIKHRLTVCLSAHDKGVSIFHDGRCIVSCPLFKDANDEEIEAFTRGLIREAVAALEKKP